MSLELNRLVLGGTDQIATLKLLREAFFSVSDTGIPGERKSEFTQQKSNCDQGREATVATELQRNRSTGILSYTSMYWCRQNRLWEVGGILRNSTDI